VGLACALAVNGLVLALIPIRRGEKWAIWLSAVTPLILLATRIAVPTPVNLNVPDDEQLQWRMCFFWKVGIADRGAEARATRLQTKRSHRSGRGVNSQYFWVEVADEAPKLPFRLALRTAIQTPALLAAVQVHT